MGKARSVKEENTKDCVQIDRLPVKKWGPYDDRQDIISRAEELLANVRANSPPNLLVTPTETINPGWGHSHVIPRTPKHSRPSTASGILTSATSPLDTSYSICRPHSANPVSSSIYHPVSPSSAGSRTSHNRQILFPQLRAITGYKEEDDDSTGCESYYFEKKLSILHYSIAVIKYVHLLARFEQATKNS